MGLIDNQKNAATRSLPMFFPVINKLVVAHFKFQQKRCIKIYFSKSLVVYLHWIFLLSEYSTLATKMSLLN